MVLKPCIPLILVGLIQFQVKPGEPGCSFPSQHAVVLKANEAVRLASQCSRPGIEGVLSIWVPNNSEISDLELSLCRFLKSNHPEIFDRLSSTYFQFVGFKLRNKRIIYINAFDKQLTINPVDGSKEAWKTRPIVVCDGGDYFWGMEYDPATNKFSRLAFNGGS